MIFLVSDEYPAPIAVVLVAWSAESVFINGKIWPACIVRRVDTGEEFATFECYLRTDIDEE